jgi:hypothetical protein
VRGFSSIEWVPSLTERPTVFDVVSVSPVFGFVFDVLTLTLTLWPLDPDTRFGFFGRPGSLVIVFPCAAIRSDRMI